MELENALIATSSDENNNGGGEISMEQAYLKGSGTVGLNQRSADSLGLDSGASGTPLYIGEADIQFANKGISAKALGTYAFYQLFQSVYLKNQSFLLKFSSVFSNISSVFLNNPSVLFKI